MKRREFVGRLGIGSAAGLITGGGVLAQGGDHEHAHGDSRPLTGNRANAVVAFGQWKSSAGLDRYVAVPPPPIAANNHQLLPTRVTIVLNGSVSFIVSGLHQVAVYAPGKRPEDVRTTPAFLRPLQIPISPTNPGPPLINDPDKRLYSGPDPSTVPLDRVEVVQFNTPGTHMVICAVLPHFKEQMIGYVRVLGKDEDE